MPRFIVFHKSLIADGSQDQLLEYGRKVLAGLAPGAEWLNSWWDAEEGRLICEWEAPTAEALRASVEPISDSLPIEALHEVQPIDPQWFR